MSESTIIQFNTPNQMIRRYILIANGCLTIIIFVFENFYFTKLKRIISLKRKQVYNIILYNSIAICYVSFWVNKIKSCNF